MKVKILQFKVTETYIHRPSNWWQRLIVRDELDQYHFDTVMKVDEDYMEYARELHKDDIVQLPNGVRLIVWSVDRFNIIKAKTYKMCVEDIRNYHPMEMYLVYPRVKQAL